MFKRGQKIEVVSYYGKGSSRPKIGDIGYLSNMFLYPSKKFILADAVFYKYGRDDKNKSRLEHKRFIIDLGMNKGLKHRIVNVGISREFFINNIYVNLTPIGYSAHSLHNYNSALNSTMNPNESDTVSYSEVGWSNHGIYPSVIGNFGIWNSLLNKKKQSPEKSKTKLPCVTIKPCSVTPKRMGTKDNINELRAWFLTVGGPTVMLMKHKLKDEYRNNDNAARLFNRVDDYYNELMHYFEDNAVSSVAGSVVLDLGKDVHEKLNSKNISTLITNLRNLEIQHQMFLNRLDTVQLTSIGSMSNTIKILLYAINYSAVDDQGDAVQKHFWDTPMSDIPINVLHFYEFILSVFFRALVNSSSTKKILNTLSDMGFKTSATFAPFSIGDIENRKKLMAFDNNMMRDMLQ